MARFPLDENTLTSLGKALMHAVENDLARASFVKDPKSYLVEAGVDESALEGLELCVHEDTDNRLNFVIPARIDVVRAHSDSDYLAELGRSVTLTCGQRIEKPVLPFAMSQLTRSQDRSLSRSAGTKG